MSSVQAAAVAIVGQVVALIVAFGIVDNTKAAVIGSLSLAVVNAAFLIAHSVHASADAKVAAATIAAKPAAVINRPGDMPAG